MYFLRYFWKLIQLFSVRNGSFVLFSRNLSIFRRFDISIVTWIYDWNHTKQQLNYMSYLLLGYNIATDKWFLRLWYFNLCKYLELWMTTEKMQQSLTRWRYKLFSDKCLKTIHLCAIWWIKIETIPYLLKNLSLYHLWLIIRLEF